MLYKYKRERSFPTPREVSEHPNGQTREQKVRRVAARHQYAMLLSETTAVAKVDIALSSSKSRHLLFGSISLRKLT